MKIAIKFTDTPHDETLRTYAEEKVAAFEKLLDAAHTEAALCGVELRRSTHHQKGDVCYAEMTLEANGALYRASKEASTLEEAMDAVKDDIVRQMSRQKNKREGLFRRGSRLAKRLLRGV